MLFGWIRLWLRGTGFNICFFRMREEKQNPIAEYSPLFTAERVHYHR